MKPLTLAVHVLWLFATACGDPASSESPASAPQSTELDERPRNLPRHDLEARQPLTACDAVVPGVPLAIVAIADGLVVGRLAPPAEEPAQVAQRYHGTGCALEPDGTAPIALDELLDADDLGNVYGYPRPTSEPGTVPTDETYDFVHRRVVRVDPAEGVSTTVEAGRGVWTFGVSPQGQTFYVTACGPTGIYANAQPLTPAMESPTTLWAQYPSVLTDDGTFWSVGARTCAYGAELSPDCGFALTRTTSAGSEALSSTVFDLGRGYERATLSRCGKGVCGRLLDGVAVWNEEGQLLRTLHRSDLRAEADEAILQVSGNGHGLYVLLSGSRGSRIAFIPAETALSTTR